MMGMNLRTAKQEVRTFGCLLYKSHKKLRPYKKKPYKTVLIFFHMFVPFFVLNTMRGNILTKLRLSTTVAQKNCMKTKN